MLAIAALRRAGHWQLAMHNEGGWKNTGDRDWFPSSNVKVGLHGFWCNFPRRWRACCNPFDVTISTYSPQRAEVGPWKDFGVARADTLEDLFFPERCHL